MAIPELKIVSNIEKVFTERPRGEVDLSGVWGACKTLAAVQAAQRLGRSLLLIASGRIEAEAAYDDVASFAGEDQALLFPAWEVLPHDRMNPADDIMAERLHTLERLDEAIANETSIYVVTSIRALMQYVIPRQQLNEKSLWLEVGKTVPMEDLISELIRLGYVREIMVEQRGEFSVRGGIVDVFPLSSELPCRIEYFDDMIESIRLFEPETQRSVSQIKSVRIPPRSEKSGLTGALRCGGLAPLADYLRGNTLVAIDEPLAVHEHAIQIESQCANSPFFMTWEQVTTAINKFPRLFLNQFPRKDSGTAIKLSLRSGAIDSFSGNTEGFWEQLCAWEADGFSVQIFCVNPGEQRRLLDLLQEQGYRPEQQDTRIRVEIGRLRAGFVSLTDKLVLLSEREIFGRHYIRRKRRRFEAGATITQFSDLRSGDYVVHEIHGIGRYVGMRTFEGRTGDYLAIQYAGGDTIYVPATMLDQLQKYMGGDGVVPKLDKIGGATWARTKDRVRRKVREMTDELLTLYAAREQSEGYAFSADTPWQIEFEDAFEYEETPDQLRAIADVKRDMEQPKPMDRLLCGDVGYGKTEVALRAAFKAVMDRKQVALLAPTTVLVEQHYNTFRERFADYPIRVEALNRFRTAREIRSTIERLKSGEVDVVIGTHRLLSKDVNFHDLGLVIIDEEQRFGVRHKERLKQLRTSVDVLTMSATPIPRTLHFSLIGLRDMSLINTAPNDRLPIHTCIEAWDRHIIREAIERELAREGQVYFLHNRVQTIGKVVEFLKKMFPHARIGMGHGQMHTHELEEVMTAFINHELDILVCTTIIASGIDIPNANTIIVDRADQFGLSQLYQIRGRVGRYKHRAFAYMLIPGDKALTQDAQQRLKALEDFSTLGSGFRIAMRDLEIRGAGDLLGAEQSGNIATVGYETYKDLIAEVVAEAQGIPCRKRFLPPFDIATDAYIPDEYVLAAPQKITLYRRIASATSQEEIDELSLELRDRFGPLPQPVCRLLRIMEVRALASEVGARALDASSTQIRIHLNSNALFMEGLHTRLQKIYGPTLSFSWADKPSILFKVEPGQDPLDTTYRFIRGLKEVFEEE